MNEAEDSLGRFQNTKPRTLRLPLARRYILFKYYLLYCRLHKKESTLTQCQGEGHVLKCCVSYINVFLNM